MTNICRIETNNDLIKIIGVINFDTVTLLAKQGVTLFMEHEKLNFDFSEVDQADSSAIALLLNWLRKAKDVNKSLSFINLPSQLLEIASVCEVMPFLSNHISHQQKNKTNG